MDSVFGEKCQKINLIPKEAWDNIYILKNRFKSHHVEKKALKFRDGDGSIKKADRDNIRVAWEYFKKVFNRDEEIDGNHANKREEKRKIFEIADPIAFAEI